jgi:hypothetical protein
LTLPGMIVPPASVGRQGNAAASGEHSNNRNRPIRQLRSLELLSHPVLGQGQTNVRRMSGTLVRGMEFDRKWGRAHKVKDKRVTAGIRRRLAERWDGPARTTPDQRRREERVFAIWRS